MRYTGFIVPILIALSATACARAQQAGYVIDPATGRPVPVVQQYGQVAAPGYAPYGQAGYAQTGQASAPAYAYQQQQVQSGGRGLFTGRGLFSSSSSSAAPAYADQYAPQDGVQPGYEAQADSGRQPIAGGKAFASTVMQYHPPQHHPQKPTAQAAYAAADYAGAAYGRRADYAYAEPTQPYTLDSGDKLRIVVFGQEGLTASYLVDASGRITMPLIGSVPARGYTTTALSRMIAERLRQGYVRNPSVTVSVEAYRPFFILGEVTTPGQYPYVPNMTAETAVAIAGGFSPRAYKSTVKLTRNVDGQQVRADVPMNYPLLPGDTVMVKERWF